MDKKKCFRIVSEETGLNGLIVQSTEQLAENIQVDIEGHMESYPEDEQVNYRIEIVYMTQKELDELPDYEP